MTIPFVRGGVRPSCIQSSEQYRWVEQRQVVICSKCNAFPATDREAPPNRRNLYAFLGCEHSSVPLPSHQQMMVYQTSPVHTF